MWDQAIMWVRQASKQEQRQESGRQVGKNNACEDKGRYRKMYVYEYWYYSHI